MASWRQSFSQRSKRSFLVPFFIFTIFVLMKSPCSCHDFRNLSFKIDPTSVLYEDRAGRSSTPTTDEKIKLDLEMGIA